MKTTKFNCAVMAALIFSSAAGFAQEDPLLSETDQVVHTDEINLDGFYKKKKKTTEADKIQKLRRELEEKHEQMMRKNVEDMRLKEERRIAKKIQKALEGQIKAMDEINSIQAAPVRSQAIAAPVEPQAPELENKISVQTGFKSIAGDQKEWTAGFNFDAAVETKVSDRVNIGLSVGYMNMSIDAGDLATSNSYSCNYYGCYSTGGYYHSSNDEITYNEFNFGGYAKFYFSRKAKIKPFVSLGTKVHFGNFQIENANNSFGETELSNRYISGGASLGAEVTFAKEFGVQFALNYDKNIFRMGEEDENASSANEFVLNNQAQNLDGADSFTLGVGLQYLF